MSEQTQQTSRADRQREVVEKILGNLLGWGVISSVVVVVAGLVLLFVQHPEYVGGGLSVGEVAGRRTGYPHTPVEVLKGAVKLEAPAVIMLGLLLLIITPVMRVIASIAAFAFQRDWIFTAITTAVLAILVLAFWMGKV